MSEEKTSMVLEVKEAFQKAFDNFNKGVATAGDYADKFGTKVTGLKDRMDKLQGTVGSVVGALGGMGVLKGSYEEFQKNEQALLRLNKAFENSNGAIGLTKKELIDLREELDAKTLFGGDEISEAQTKLMSFGTMTGDVFTRTSKVMLDFATFTKTDAVGAASALGKALSNPTEAFGLLSKQGINFTDNQERAIRKMVESGNIMGAQEIILGRMEKAFGGFAEGATEGSGQIALFKEDLEEFAEELGKILVDYMVPFIKWVKAEILPTMMKWKTEIAVFVGVLSALAVAWGTVSAGLAVAVPIIGLVKSAWVGLQVVMKAGMLTNPILLGIVGIAAAVYGVVKVVQNWGTISQWLSDKWTMIKIVFTAAVDILAKFVPAIALMKLAFEQVGKLIEWLVPKITEGFKTFGDWISSKLNPIILTISETFEKVTNTVKGYLSKMGGWIVDTIINPIASLYQKVFGSALDGPLAEAKAKMEAFRKEVESRNKETSDKAVVIVKTEEQQKAEARAAGKKAMDALNQNEKDKVKNKEGDEEKKQKEKDRKDAIKKEASDRAAAIKKEEDEIKKKYGFLSKEDRAFLKEKEKQNHEENKFKLKEEQKEFRKEQQTLKRKMTLTEKMSSKAADQVIAEEQRVADEKEAMETKKMMIENNIGDARMQAAGDFFGQMAQLQQTKSKEMFEVGKAFAIGEAIMNTYTGITKTLATYPFPISAAMAAAQAALGFTQVQQIASSTPQFENGGGFFGGAVGATTGSDNMNATVRAGEMYLNARQQRNLFSRIDSNDLGSGSSGGGGNTYITNTKVTVMGNGDKQLKKLMEKTIENKEKRKLQKQQFVKGRFAT